MPVAEAGESFLNSAKNVHQDILKLLFSDDAVLCTVDVLGDDTGADGEGT